MVSPRQAVLDMQPYSPPTGERADKLRLDFNENTVGCSPRVAEFLSSGLSRGLVATYPDYAEARFSLAAHFRVPEDQLVITNGTDEAIQITVNAFVEPGDSVLVLRPSYAMYRFYSELAGARIREADYRPEDLALPFDRVLELAAKSKVVFLSNPNNPTGSLASANQIRALLETASETAVLVDEAYFEFSGETVLTWINEYPNLLVSRTLSKAYGLAGLRCGLLFSCGDNVAVLRKVQSPYSVNMVAALAAVEAVQDSDYLQDYVRQVLVQRERTATALSSLGVRVAPSHGNFLLLWAGDTKDELISACLQAGVLVRDRSHEIEGTVRVTIGTAEQMDRFLGIAEDLWTGV